MSVDVSNRRFYLNESPTLESKSISGSFTSKSPAGNYGQRWGQILVSTTEIRYYYLAGSYVQVYSSGAWVDNDYRVIVFAPNTSLLDYEYEWIAANSTEVTPYFTSNESLGKVANAIRERSWTKSLLTYPDGYDAAIRAIGNYAEGATVAWNQIIPANYSTGTYTCASDTTVYAQRVYIFSPNEINYYSGHKYYISATVDSSISTTTTVGFNVVLQDNTSLTPVRVEDPDTTATGSIIVNMTSDGYLSSFRLNNYTGKRGYETGDYATFSDVMIIDLTVLLGTDIADQIYALEQDTAGDGVAAFKALFPSDYYQPQLTPVLSSVNYQDDIPVNDPVELLGVYRLDSDSNIVRDGDVYNDGQMYKRYVEIALDGLTWTYNSTYDFFSAGPVGPGSKSVTGPYAQDLFINAISDYEPLTLWDYGTRTESELAAADDGMYLCYISTVQAAAINLLYIKDSTITSDHENTLMAKLAGKKIIMAFTNPYYTTT